MRRWRAVLISGLLAFISWEARAAQPVPEIVSGRASWLKCKPSTIDDTAGTPGTTVKVLVTDGLSTPPSDVWTACTASWPETGPVTGMLHWPSGWTSAEPLTSPVSFTVNPGVPVPAMLLSDIKAAPPSGAEITGASRSETLTAKATAPELLKPFLASAVNASGPVVTGAG